MKTSKLLEVRENANDQVAIIFSFTSGWLGGWHMYSDQLQSKVKKKNISDYFRHSIDIRSLRSVGLHRFACGYIP